MPRSLWLLLALIALAAAGWQGLRSAGATGEAELVIANGPDPRSLDPAAVTAMADARVLSALFEGLLNAHPATLEPVPGLAAALPAISADGLVYTFPIREGLVWSDGEPLDAEGIRWSYLRFLDPRTAARFTDPLTGVRGAARYHREGGAELREAVGIRAPSPRELVIELEEPLPSLPSLLTLFPVYPVPRHLVEAHGDRWTKPGIMAGNGPYKLEEWKLRNRIRVVRNPRYRNAKDVSIASIDYLCVESPATMLNLFVAGRADIITEVPASAVDALRKIYGPQAGGRFDPALRIGTYHLKINHLHPPLDQIEVRQALSAAIDRRAIAESIMRAGERPATSFVPAGVACGDAVYQPPSLRDPPRTAAGDLLRRGLDKAGIPVDSFVLELIYSTSEATDQPIAELIQEAWSSLGIRVRLANLDSGSVRDAVSRGRYQIARASWIGDYNDPSTFLDLYVTGGARNQSGWSKSRYDKIVLQQARRARTGAERARLYREAESILLEDVALIPVYHYVSRSLVRRGIDGFHPNILDWHPPEFLRITEPRR